MYIQFIHHCPAPGKGPELRALLEEWAKTAPARGFRHNLGSRILGPEGQDFVNGIQHEDLAAFETYPQRSQANPAFATFSARQQPLLSRPAVTDLYEVLVPAPAGPRRFTYRVGLYPAIGKGPAVRGLLEDRVKALQGRGFLYGLQAKMFSEDGPVFAAGIGFEDLTALETYLQNNRRDPEFQAFNEKIQPLLGRPIKSELYQVLVPFPPRS